MGMTAALTRRSAGTGGCGMIPLSEISLFDWLWALETTILIGVVVLVCWWTR